MRVISGKYRGRKIETIDSKKLRPTTGMAREALFNILTHGRFAEDDKKLLDGCRVLDLFCGCGALSMEAISRGASHATMMDIDQEHLDIAKKNFRSVDEIENAAFIRGDSSTPPPAHFPCNLIFLDPPYGKGFVATSLKNLIAGRWLADNAVVVVETAKNEEPEIPEGFVEVEDRKYGNSRIRIFEWQKSGA
jgi:16S rRNA (guanine966-N2)-methyltransferase